ncbi:hypothetical protein HK101_001848, partial [Irineochytrium annulatum]
MKAQHNPLLAIAKTFLTSGIAEADIEAQIYRPFMEALWELILLKHLWFHGRVAKRVTDQYGYGKSTVDGVSSFRRLKTAGNYGEPFTHSEYFHAPDPSLVTPLKNANKKKDDGKKGGCSLKFTAGKDLGNVNGQFDVTAGRAKRDQPLCYVNTIPAMHAYAHDSYCQSRFRPHLIAGIGAKFD